MAVKEQEMMSSTYHISQPPYQFVEIRYSLHILFLYTLILTHTHKVTHSYKVTFSDQVTLIKNKQCPGC